MSTTRAIELGKIWMKNSHDPSHDYEHALLVEQHALRIYEELKPEGVTEDEVSLACWWHDCYKARCKGMNLYDMWAEGTEARKIFEKELASLIPAKDIKSVGEAIENHNRGIFLFFHRTFFDPLSMILIEADQIDGLRKDRNEKGRKNVRNLFAYITDVLLSDLVPFYLKLIHRSKYTEEILKLYYSHK